MSVSVVFSLRPAAHFSRKMRPYCLTICLSRRQFKFRLKSLFFTFRPKHSFGSIHFTNVLQMLKGFVDNVDNLVNNGNLVTFRTHFRVDNRFPGKYYQLFSRLFTVKFLIRFVQGDKSRSCQPLFFIRTMIIFSENCSCIPHNLQSKLHIRRRIPPSPVFSGY